MTRVRNIVLLAICSNLMVACNNPSPQKANNRTEQADSTSRILLELNQSFIQLEIEEIETYISENNLSMIRSENGFWYHIEKEGAGKKIQSRQIVSIAYSVQLLSGKLCYESDKDGIKEFKVGKYQVEKGVDDMMLLLNAGAEATCIIPSYLAHGVVGDRMCIPPRTPILYNIKVISIKDN